MWVKRCAALLGSGVLGLVCVIAGAAPASAGDRPADVAFVHAFHLQVLHHDGTVTAIVGARCVPGWAAVEVDVRITQGDSDAEGFVVPTIACDNRWHPVMFRLTDVAGTFEPGAIAVSSQILVTNNESGDSAGGHDNQRKAVAVFLHKHCGHA